MFQGVTRKILQYVYGGYYFDVELKNTFYEVAQGHTTHVHLRNGVASMLCSIKML